MACSCNEKDGGDITIGSGANAVHLVFEVTTSALDKAGECTLTYTVKNQTPQAPTHAAHITKLIVGRLEAIFTPPIEPGKKDVVVMKR